MHSHMNGILQKVRTYIKQHSLISENEKCMIAVSGGMDSMAASAIMTLISRRKNFHVDHMIYCDHGIRERHHIDYDISCVERLSKAIDVPFYVKKLTLKSSSETDARNARYACLIEDAKVTGCSKIVTGHHADDQAETVIVRLLKGGALGALRGIRPSVNHDGIHVIRPLLSLSKESIKKAMTAEFPEIVASYDVTNSDTDIERNWIRNVLLPTVHDRFPEANERIARVASNMASMLEVDDEME